jgi:hypothetical protein
MKPSLGSAPWCHAGIAAADAGSSTRKGKWVRLARQQLQQMCSPHCLAYPEPAAKASAIAAIISLSVKATQQPSALKISQGCHVCRCWGRAAPTPRLATNAALAQTTLAKAMASAMATTSAVASIVTWPTFAAAAAAEVQSNDNQVQPATSLHSEISPTALVPGQLPGNGRRH